MYLIGAPPGGGRPPGAHTRVFQIFQETAGVVQIVHVVRIMAVVLDARRLQGAGVYRALRRGSGGSGPATPSSRGTAPRAHLARSRCRRTALS